MRVKYLLSIALLVIAISHTSAQGDEFDKDVGEFLRINGSTSAFAMASEHFLLQYRNVNSNIPDDQWNDFRMHYIDREIAALHLLLIPLYKRYFTHEEIKALIKFYRSPLGKKVTGTIDPIARESMTVATEWANGLEERIAESFKQFGL